MSARPFVFLTVILSLVMFTACGKKTEITTDPAGATVFVNDKEQGVTPAKLELKPGTYNVKVEKEGYLAVIKEIKVTKEDQGSISEKMMKIEELPRKWVAAKAGLVLREKPDQGSKKLGVIPVKTMVYIVEVTKKEFKMKQYNGTWVKVADGRNPAQVGYVVNTWLHDKEIKGDVISQFNAIVGAPGGPPVDSALMGFGVSYTVMEGMMQHMLTFGKKGAVYRAVTDGAPGPDYKYCVYNYIIKEKVSKTNYRVFISCNPMAGPEDIRDYSPTGNGELNHMADLIKQAGQGQSSAEPMKNMEFEITTWYMATPDVVKIKYNNMVYRFRD